MRPLGTFRHWSLAGLLAALVGCGGGGDGELVGIVGVAQAEWIVLDLTTGSTTGLGTAPDLSDDAYRSSKMVFVALPAGSANLGSPVGTRWGLPDEVLGAVATGRSFLAVFEVTRGQWQRLMNTTPWTAIAADLQGAGDERAPVSGVSVGDVSTACAAGNARFGGSFRLPNATEWEYACRAGSAGRFSWGDATDSAIVNVHAQVAEYAGPNPGPQRVGQRLANAFGLYDMEGGVWELCSDAVMCGGSWRDSLPMARAANRVAIDSGTPYPLAGARLIYRPETR